MGGKSLSRTRLIWLGGAVALIVIGLALAYLNPPPTAQSVSTAINVELPPTSGAHTACRTSTGAGTGGSSATLLTPAPEPGMIEDTPNGPLPIVGKDGHQAWQVYARPFDSKDVRPRIALIVTGVGLDQTLSQAALDRLPGTITFGFDPYADNVKDNIANARNLGHEALLGLPLEPLDYPRQDPGPADAADLARCIAERRPAGKADGQSHRLYRLRRHHGRAFRGRESEPAAGARGSESAGA